MKRYLYALRYLVSIHLLGLLFFAAFRLVLFLQGYDYLAGENLSVLTRAEAFARGLWLDNVVACYIMILPLTVVSVCALMGYYGKALFKGVNIFFSIFYVLAFAISAADIPYFAYFFKHINASIFNWFGYAGTTLGLMFGEFSYIVAFVLFLALSFLFVYLARLLRQRTCLDIHRVSAEKFHWGNELLTLLASIVLIGGCMFGIRGRVGYNPIKVSAAYYCNNTFLNQLGVSPSFNLLRSSLEASKSENREIDLMDDHEAIAQVRREFHITDSLPDVSPIARRVENPGEPTRQNVVLIFMESMSAELMGHFGNPWQLTPFLDTIATKSLCFNRFFSAGTHTNHAIHSTLYSYPALMKRNSMKGAVIPFFAGLPTILQDNGYSTLFFMTHESQYDNMNGYLRTNGFDRIFAQEDYPKEKVVNSFGVQDDFLYQYALPVLTQTAREGKPFFAALLSISNHPPYVIPKDFKARNNTDELRIVEFADHALEQFITQASREEWFDNTIFVFVGDHGKIVGTPRSDMPLSFNHVPLLIYAPSTIEPRQIDDLGGQTDIAPTLLGLLHIDYTNNGFGVDLLREKRPAVVFTSDDAIGCVNDSLFYIYKPKENQEWLLAQEKGIEKSGDIDNREARQSLRDYSFSILQTAQYLMSNSLTGKYIGYQPR
ncbi:alkaline phosphatase family protein [Barnesiella sp. An55]|uniref:LTA synthase family protein n=1 Tax=Barnesiella sp. An55 TaxID=1965646 RepID=UPI000B3780BB|nr:alkaline phosphatase family protein [Barnesiella sp. An55]OUN74399.1 phosphoglycerol transferase [Barnesiella sp. An55]HIZ27200.1 sulfatase-like hydrolase/transferase [Candidatus Barnesiella merdipullorum]